MSNTLTNHKVLAFLWRIVGRLLMLVTLPLSLLLWVVLYVPLGDDTPDFPGITVTRIERWFGL